MTTAQVLFEQYKVLPQGIQQQLKQLIVQAAQPAARPPAVDEDDDDGDTDTHVSISMEAIHASIEQIKLLRAGKAKLSTLEELFAELEADE